jgi:cation diffusion facilitator family transporter
MSGAIANYQIQKKITIVVAVMFAIKLIAWYLTSSVAILTDALEYTINVISSLIGLYSLSLSAKPKDYNHPYGHGKVEFLSSSIEGILMIVSSFLIMYEAINNLQHPHTISKLDYGICLVAFTALLNYFLGHFSIKQGKKTDSLPLVAAGKHLQSDTYATIAIIIGLIAIYFTHFSWIDSLVAFVFALVIIISGYKILRSSIAGIMDEADDALLRKVVEVFESNRNENWVDLHNLRIIKYGGTLHLDCHLTVPWYFNVNEAHKEIDRLSSLVKNQFGESVELFVHTDGCLDFSCRLCNKKTCDVRKFDFDKIVHWTVENVSTNCKHQIAL